MVRALVVGDMSNDNMPVEAVGTPHSNVCTMFWWTTLQATRRSPHQSSWTLSTLHCGVWLLGCSRYAPLTLGVLLIHAVSLPKQPFCIMQQPFNMPYC
jgi:hypothetical protein